MTKNRKFNFTKKALETIESPTKDKEYYYDLKVHGLCLCVTKNGVKTFYLYRKVNGRPERIRIGKFPDFSIENARSEASNLNHLIERGVNPNQEKQKIKAELTFGDLFDRYIKEHAKIHKKSWEEDVSQYKRYLESLGRKRLSSLNRTLFQALHTKIGKDHGPYAANRTLALLKTIFNKATLWGWDGENPIIGIQKFKEKSRERFLHAEELPRLFEALNQESNETFRDFFYVSLLTGARRSNVQSMKWGDININNLSWRIPETKNGEAHIVVLVAEVLEILERRRANSESKWVFPSLTSKSGHIEEPKSAWKKILKRANLTDLRLHDLRRTLGSWQAATGANSYVIGKSLGHKSQQATAVYARLNLDPGRESLGHDVKAMMATQNKE